MEKKSVLQIVGKRIRRCMDPLNSNWLFEFNDDEDLKAIFERLGLLEDGLTLFEYFTRPVNEAILKDVLQEFLENEDSTFRLRYAAYLTGLTDNTELTEQLIAVLEQKRADPYDRLIIYKSLYLMRIDFKKWRMWIESDLDKEQIAPETTFIYLKTLLEAGEKLDPSRLDYLCRNIDLDDHDEMLESLTHLDSDQHAVSETWKNFVLKETLGQDFFLPLKAEWLRKNAPPQVWQELFSRVNNDDLVLEILLTAIAEPEDWRFLKEILDDYINSWVHSDKGKTRQITMAFMTLFGLWGHDFSQFYTSSRWYLQTGAFLARLGDPRPLDSEELSEIDTSDADVALSIKILRLLRGDGSFLLYRNILSLLLDSENYVRHIVAALFVGLGKEPEYPEMAEIHCLFHSRWIGKEQEPLSDEILRFGMRSFSNILEDEIPQYFNVVPGNLHLIAFSDFMKDKALLLEELFIDELNYRKAEGYLMIIAYHGLPLRSPEARLKAQFHRFSDFRLTPEEYRLFFPFIASTDVSYEYVSRFISAAGTFFKAKPSDSALLYRRWKDSEDVRILLEADANTYQTNFYREGGGEYPMTSDKMNQFLALNPINEALLPELLNLCMDKSVDKNLRLHWLWECRRHITSSNKLDLVMGMLIEILGHGTKELAEILSLSSVYMQEALMRYCRSHLSSVPVEIIYQGFSSTEDSVARLGIEALVSWLERHNRFKQVFVFEKKTEESAFKDVCQEFQEDALDPEDAAAFLGQRFIIKEIGAEDLTKSELNPKPVRQWIPLLLYLSIDYASDDNKHIVVSVNDDKSGEIIKWLIEKNANICCTLVNA